jgi:hypothetical protein
MTTVDVTLVIVVGPPMSGLSVISMEITLWIQRPSTKYMVLKIHVFKVHIFKLDILYLRITKIHTFKLHIGEIGKIYTFSTCGQ